MAKKDRSVPKTSYGNKEGKLRDGHRVGDNSNPKAWQPIRDRTTTPPKGEGGDKKK